MHYKVVVILNYLLALVFVLEIGYYHKRNIIPFLSFYFTHNLTINLILLHSFIFIGICHRVGLFVPTF